MLGFRTVKCMKEGRNARGMCRKEGRGGGCVKKGGESGNRGGNEEIALGMGMGLWESEIDGFYTTLTPPIPPPGSPLTPHRPPSKLSPPRLSFLFQIRESVFSNRPPPKNSISCYPWVGSHTLTLTPSPSPPRPPVHPNPSNPRAPSGTPGTPAPEKSTRVLGIQRWKEEGKQRNWKKNNFLWGRGMKKFFFPLDRGEGRGVDKDGYLCMIKWSLSYSNITELDL